MSLIDRKCMLINIVKPELICYYSILLFRFVTILESWKWKFSLYCCYLLPLLLRQDVSYWIDKYFTTIYKYFSIFILGNGPLMWLMTLIAETSIQFNHLYYHQRIVVLFLSIRCRLMSWTLICINFLHNF